MPEIKIKIDKDGMLKIKRGSELKYQDCPYKDELQYYHNCGDWCPKFGEPEPAYDDNPGFIAIELCDHKIIECSEEEFLDERE